MKKQSASELTSSILKALGKEDDPISVIIEEVIEQQLNLYKPPTMNKVAQFASTILKQYANENGTTVRGTSDLSPLEQWLIIQLSNNNKNHSTQDLIDLMTEFTNGGTLEETQEKFPNYKRYNREHITEWLANSKNIVK